MLLPREHVPLSSLDLSVPHGDFSSSRFYESRIKILDLEGRLGSNLLIARSATNRVAYAIERESDGLYTLCKLGAWVDVGKLAQLATATCRQRLESYKSVPQPSNGPFALTTPQIHKDNKKKRLAIEEIQSMIKKRARSQSVATISMQEPNLDISADVEAPAGDGQEDKETHDSKTPTVQLQAQTLSQADITEAAFSQPTAEDIFQNIRTQYAEALYHSMGSLAYFAKGPLSRARAAFHLDCDANLDMVDLVDFLKSLVMTTVVIDKKYRETMPALISKLKTYVDDSDNGESKTRKRKPKKMKLGKDGLYPAEEEHIRFWWSTHKPTDPEEKSATGEEVKYHISCLRRRETQLQMIIILEILALEPLARPKENAEDSQLPGLESGPSTAPAEAPAKKRNKHNFPVLLDVHADRLCIWQSTTLDEVKALAESQDQATKSEKPNSDLLKDFCVDIILPFFSARLPEICDSINRKLGGPVIKSPLKPRQSKPTGQPHPKPGASMKKPPLLKRDREKTLERVLSDERMRRSVSRGPANTLLAHMRSASATTIPGLKKEASDSLLSMIPKRGEREMTSLKPRTNSLFSRSSSTSSIMTEDQKARKKALVEAELQEAISALKRPNRALAGKEIVQEVEQRRASTSLSQLKKARKPVHRIPGAGSAYPAVHIKATPANNRFKDVIAAESQQHASLPELDIIKDEDDHEDRIPASSSVVPSSGVARRVTSTPFHAVQATPARGSARATLPPVSMAPVSPVLTRKAVNRGSFLPVPGSVVLGSSPGTRALFETPLKPRSAMGDLSATPVRPLRLTGSATRGTAVIATPEKRREMAVVATPEKRVEWPEQKQTEVSKKTEEVKENKPETVSIYQRLGWDDDYDLD